jgi:deazaflavin-dependent oxidoreductase (nitroreductase family)
MQEDRIRLSFKYFNKFMVLLWKLGLSNWLNIWPKVLGRYLVITHTGRKSGAKFQTPVNYAVVDGEIYCVAGFGRESDWYKNVKKNPSIDVWLQDGWWQANAEEVIGQPNQIEIMRAVLVGSGFAARMFGINPLKIDDATLKYLTRDYCLMKLKLVNERTGNDGPNQYAWVWPITTLLLTIAVLRKRKK